MHNYIATITGQKGSGKTSFAKFLLTDCRRVVVFDRLLEYDAPPGGVVCRYVDDALAYLTTNWRSENLYLVARFRDNASHAILFAFIRECSDRCPSLPLTLCIEEVDFFATPLSIDTNLYDMVAYGRHWSISSLFVVRGDTDTHRIITNNSDCLVAMRQYRFSSPMLQKFGAQDAKKILALQTFKPGIGSPVYGTHYLTHPADTDINAEWKGITEHA